ncbi:uncharacterized protein ACNLHF_003009 isoform 2-T2 [Anomaloglossus baeobatrachus]
MKILLSIWTIVSIYITTGDALSCITCLAEDWSSPCSGGAHTCPDGFVCKSVYQQSSQDDAKLLQMACAHPSECTDRRQLYTENQVTWYQVSSCCDTDFCKPPLPPSQFFNSISSGVKGPSCTSFMSVFRSCKMHRK